jgi:hypothetical protein
LFVHDQQPIWLQHTSDLGEERSLVADVHAHIEHPDLSEQLIGQIEIGRVGDAIGHTVVCVCQLGERLGDLDAQRQQVHPENRAAEAVGEKPAWPADTTAEIEHQIVGRRRAVLRDDVRQYLEHAVHPEVVAIDVAFVEIARSGVLRIDTRNRQGFLHRFE